MIRSNEEYPEKKSCFCHKKMHVFVTKIMGKHAQSVYTKILGAIRSSRPGTVMTPASFKGLGSPAAVRVALLRLRKNGAVRQLTRGLYDRPRYDPQVGAIAPSLDSVAAAVKDRDSVRIQPSGAYAANILGLSEQVPMRVVFLTDGGSRAIRLGRQTISFRRTTPRNLATAGKTSGLVIQALRHLGQKHVDDSTVGALRRRLSDKDRRQLQRDIRYAPAWIGEVMRKLAASSSPKP
jgi:hypothetical protein